jgi:hypothetical protein
MIRVIPRTPNTRPTLLQFSCHALCVHTHTGTWLLPHLHTRTKAASKSLAIALAKDHANKTAPSILNIIASYVTPRLDCSGLKFLKAAGYIRQLCLVAARPTHTNALSASIKNLYNC